MVTATDSTTANANGLCIEILRLATIAARNITSTAAGTSAQRSPSPAAVLAADEQGNTVTIGSTTAANAVNVYFGNADPDNTVNGVAPNTPVEGVLWANTNINFLNTVTAASLSILGTGQNGGTITLSNPGNSIAGNVVINGGSVTTANELGLGSNVTPGAAGNHVVLNGGVLSFTNAVTTPVNHNIDIGAAGGGLVFGASTSYNGNISDLSSLTSGFSAGPLSIAAGANTVTFTNTTSLSGQNQWTGGTTVTSTTGSLVVANNVNFGTGDVSLFVSLNRGNGTNGYNTVLTLQGNNNLAPTAGVNLDFGSTLNLTNTAPIIGSIEGSGSVVLATSGTATNVTLGGNNRNTVFDGVISQASGATASGITKSGTGTFTFAGMGTYSGLTSVNNGTLLLNGSISGNGGGAVNNGTLRVLGSLSGSGALAVGDQVATHAATLSGTGRIAGPVTVNGPGASGIGGTIAGASGSTLTLTNGLTLNDGSMSSFTINNTPNPTGPALIATSGGGGNSLGFATGTNHVNLFGTTAVGDVYDLFSYTGTVPAGTFALNTAGITTPNVSFKIDLTVANQVDLIVGSSNTDLWTNAGTSPSNPGVWDIGVTQNWARSVSPTAPSTYSDGDNVVFNDTNSINSSTLSSPQVITVASAVNPNSVVFSNNAVSYSVGGAAITGNGSLTVNGGGSVTLTGSSNAYGGGTFITNGTLILAASSTPTSGTVTSGPVGTNRVTLGAGNGSSPATLDLGASGGFTVANAITVQSGSSGLMTIGGLNTTASTNTFSGNITLNQSATVSEVAGSGTLAFTGAITPGASGTLTFAPGAGATITAGGVIGGGSGTLAVTQNGAGTTILSGANSYGGTTSVTTGTLRVTGSLSGTGPVNVAVCGNLGCGACTSTVSIAGLVTVGGHLAPNGLTGTVNNLTLNGGLTLSNNSFLDYKLGNPAVPTTSDLVTLGNGTSLTLGSNVTLDITQGASYGLGTYELINYGTGSSVSNPSNLSGWSTTGGGGGKVFTFVNNTTSGNHEIDLVITQGTASSQWDVAASGDYGVSTNWQGGTYPDGTVAQPQTATFATGSTGEINNVNIPSGMLTVDNISNPVSPHLGGITFDNAQVSYTLSSGPITLNNNNMGATINVTAGSHFITSNLSVSDISGLTITPASSSSLTVSGTLNNGNNPLFVAGAGNTTLNGAISGSGAI